MKILLLGDCHDRIDLVASAMVDGRRLLGTEAAIQVGDFGLCEPVMKWMADNHFAFPYPLHVVPGNHDDHQFLFHADRDGSLNAWRYHNLFAVHKPATLRIGEAIIAFCGGALQPVEPQAWAGRKPLGLNAPFARRQPPKDPAWANFVTTGNAMRLAAMSADLWVTHSCPHSIGVGMIGDQRLVPSIAMYCDHIGLPAGPLHDCGEPGLTLAWKEAKLRPKNWVYGHFHTLRQSRVGDTLFTCVGSSDNSDGVKGARAVTYDTESRLVEVHPHILLGG